MRLVVVAWCVVGGAGGVALGEDRYFAVPMDELVLTEGALPDYEDADGEGAGGDPAGSLGEMWAYAALDGGGEAFVVLSDERSGTGVNWSWWAWNTQQIDPSWFVLVGRVPGGDGGGGSVEGALFVPEVGFASMRRVRFSVPVEDQDADAARFHRGRAAHYDRLLSGGFTGAAWFRHQRDRSRVLAHVAEGEGGEGVARTGWMNPRGADASETYALFTGGRAIAENLALDRAVVVQEEGAVARDVEIGSLEGIEIAEIDWSAMMPADAAPRLDDLAGVVPHDQPVMFFPSVAAGERVLELALMSALPGVQQASASGGGAGVREGVLERYEAQLGVRVAELVAMGERGEIGAVALTASDPYLRTGTDLALVMASGNARGVYGSVRALLEERFSGAVEGGGVAGITGSAEEGSIWVSPDRSVSAFLGVVGGGMAGGEVVVLTNSAEQLERLRAAGEGALSSVGGLAEYAFFRHRHERTDDEAMFLVLTDATIRKWCGPEWRIGASRRVRAHGALLDLHAEYLDGMVRDRLGEVAIEALSAPLVGDAVVVTSDGARSAAFNTIGFLTPISELDLGMVTTAEAQGYRNWKQGYERGWRTMFDPIAVRLRMSDGVVEADASVLPLRGGGGYEEMIGLSLGEALEPDDGDPHEEALAQLILAINRESELFRSANEQVAPFFPQVRARPFEWVGDAISLYAEEDEAWWARVGDSMDDRGGEIDLSAALMVGAPFGLHVEVSNPLMAAGFLTSVRAFVSGAAPGMLSWSNRTHAGKDYVRIAAADVGMLGEEFADLEIFYFAAASGLTVSLNEGVVQRAIDRAAGGDGGGGAGDAGGGGREMVGESAELMVDRRMLDLLESLGAREWARAVRAQSWSNLPALNEWKRMFPDRDPVAVHRDVWGLVPVCPAGGSYVWDAELRTMKSTALGCPAAPLAQEVRMPSFDRVLRMRGGMSFESLGGDETGLRTRLRLEMDGGDGGE
ncbi:MAG: hypothetical protein ACTS3F_01365 [Phycisphaerales bacterium]